MLKGILYTALSKYSGIIITIVITAILSRLLSPAEFGVVALVTVFIGFFNLLGNLGIGPAIVQIQDLSSRDLASIFTFSAIMAGLLAALFFLSGGLISEFYEEPELLPIVRLLSLSILFNILSIVPGALNRKELRFKQMGIIKVGVQVVAGAIGIWLAFHDYSYYAIIYQNILSAFLIFVIFYILYPISFVLKIQKEPLKKIASFSLFQFGFNFINYFSRNLDNILIGKYLGNAPLGFYNKSYNLMLLPVDNLTHVITPVLHPVLAKHQNNKDYIFKTYSSLLKILAGLGFPLSAFLYFAAPELILLLFGDQWHESIPVFKILAFTVGLQICLSSTGSIFQITNRTDLLFVTGFISAFLMVGGIAYGIFIGGDIITVAYGLVGAFLINFFQGFYFLTVKALKKPFITFFKVLIYPIVTAGLLFVLLGFINQIGIDGLILNLFIKSIMYFLSILPMFFIFEEFRLIFKKLINKE